MKLTLAKAKKHEDVPVLAQRKSAVGDSYDEETDSGGVFAGGVEDKDKKLAAVSNPSPPSKDKFSGGAEDKDKKRLQFSIRPLHPKTNFLGTEKKKPVLWT